MNTVRELVYIGADNSNDVELREDGQPENISQATRARLDLYSVTDPAAAPIIVDSNVVPSAFDWVTQGAAGVLVLKLGAVLAVVGVYNVRLTLYDAQSPNGEVFAHEVTTGCNGTAFEIQALAAA